MMSEEAIEDFFAQFKLQNRITMLTFVNENIVTFYNEMIRKECMDHTFHVFCRSSTKIFVEFEVNIKRFPERGKYEVSFNSCTRLKNEIAFIAQKAYRSYTKN